MKNGRILLNFKILLFLLILCLLLGASSINPEIANQKQNSSKFNIVSDYPLPFDGLFLEYELKVRSNYSSFWLPLDFSIYFSDNSSIPEIYQLQGYTNLMKIQASTVLTSNSYFENATFYINSDNRTMVLNENLIEGIIVEQYLILLYNGEPNVVNYNPFWINPLNLSINQKISVFSFNFSITNSFTQNYDDLGNKKIWVANFKDSLYNEIQNVTSIYDLVASYDTHTGILLQGSLNGTFNYSNETLSNYEMDFVLTNNTNAFGVFPINPLSISSNSNTGPIPGFITNLKPNFVFFTIFFSLPVVITLINFARIRKIDGGV
ncbi:MAG: hypothetical protein ACXACX_03050 [Candidatus Hodarchaeales archaeon]